MPMQDMLEREERAEAFEGVCRRIIPVVERDRRHLLRVTAAAERPGWVGLARPIR
jgi:hypothetical protein